MSEAPVATGTPDDDDARRRRIEAGIRAIREGHGANCSSIGSVIDTIFASAVVGGALFAAVVSALGSAKPRVVGEAPADGVEGKAPVSPVQERERRS